MHTPPPNRLRELRKARGIRQSVVAYHCQVDQSTAARWETGVIPWKHVATIADVLGVTVPELFGWVAKDDGHDDPKTEAA